MARTLLAAALAALLLLVVAVPATPAGASECSGGACLPSCHTTDLTVRPEVPREYVLSCWRTAGAELTGTPEGGTAEVLSGTEPLRVRFAPAAGARSGSFVLHLTGPGGATKDVTFGVRVIPHDENSPPVCESDTRTERTDGQTPLTLWETLRCSDPDGDGLRVGLTAPGEVLRPIEPQPADGGGIPSQTWLEYRTATLAGTETVRFWATDELGARSADATLTLTVGPNVNREPRCAPDYQTTEPTAVTMRAGVPRAFGIFCSDPDGDDFTTALGDAPRHGTVTLTTGLDQTSAYWGRERWIDARYVPTGASVEPDSFTVVTVADGRTGVHPFEMRPVPDGVDDGGGCGWGPADTPPDVPTTVSVTCTDSEGDPISARIVRAPEHGTASLPLLTPAPYGQTTIEVPFVPDAGFTGVDCIVLEIGDGRMNSTIQVDINVREQPAYEPPAPPEMPVSPEPPGVPLPPVPPPPGSFVPGATSWTSAAPRPTDATRSVRTPAPSFSTAGASAGASTPVADARRALGTRDVVLVRKAGALRVYADRAAWRRGVALDARTPVLAVACASASCPVRAAVAIEQRGRARAARRAGTAAGTAERGRALPLRLALTKRDRAALRGRRGLRAAFTVSAAGDRAAARGLTVRVGLRTTAPGRSVSR